MQTIKDAVDEGYGRLTTQGAEITWFAHVTMDYGMHAVCWQGVTKRKAQGT